MALQTREVGPGFAVETSGIDLAGELGDAQIERLREQWTGCPEFVYTHRWRVGDVVFRDNASLAHRRDACPCDQRRFLKRTGFHLPDELALPF